MKKPRHPGSYRDPKATVFELDHRIFRGIKNPAAGELQNFLRSNFYQQNAGKTLVATREVDRGDLEKIGMDANTLSGYALWLEHDRVEMITYPYEWSFVFLKSAALFHLDLLSEAVQSGYIIKDSSAYNIQFKGDKPLFIDIASFEPYREGDMWLGYKQFIEQFFAPLALSAYARIDISPLIRSTLDGIDIEFCAKLLPLSSYFNMSLLGNIHLQAWMMSRISSRKQSKDAHMRSSRMSQKKLLALIESLRKAIDHFSFNINSYWHSYELNHSYSDNTSKHKAEIVRDFIQRTGAKTVIDIGCNTGYYSEVARQAGAQKIIGLDVDSGAVTKAAQRPQLKEIYFIPLLYDVTNPSPAMGWKLEERMTLERRLPAVDALLCLALLHHVVIAKNIPLAEFLDWLLKRAPCGVIEFVPKTDPMVVNMLVHREDIFPDYNLDYVVQLIQEKANVCAVIPLTQSQRSCIIYDARP